jgi:hypothetical protein
MKANKKKWSEFTPTQQKLIIAGGAVEALLTSAALISLARRPKDAVRGPKALWAASLIIQPVGPLAYFTFGRRASSR